MYRDHMTLSRSMKTVAERANTETRVCRSVQLLWPLLLAPGLSPLMPLRSRSSLKPKTQVSRQMTRARAAMA